uniref:CABIT domain-containing protein n=1 Tax=Anopheles epiroticus TaxID=199890 RepID=A0A182PJQ7_9DIPT
MTDALKMTDMQQRANIEYERQRHLANWLIESSPHMPKPTAAQQKQLQQHQQQLQQQQLQQLAGGATPLTGKQSKAAAAGKLKQSPMFLLAKIGHNMNLAVGGGGAGTGGGNSLVAGSTFNSQTNLPLQILAPGGGREGNKPKLRRFNSHDTSANMFSVAEFENARLARRNELENAALLRQRARYKLNSLSSGGGGTGGGGGGGGDCSTGESKGSKLSSSESTTEPLFAEQFLERFSLPRVIRLSYTSSVSSPAPGSGHQTGDQTMTSSSSAESSSTAERPSIGSKSKSKKGKSAAGPIGSDLFLLYRYMRGYRSYHVFNTKAGTSRKKGYKIPHDFPGYFSFINDKGAPTATVYTTIVQLVRDQVHKFLSLDSLSAYTESHDNFSHKTHYVKATAKAGQVYRLLAVFQDGDHKSATSPSSHKDGSGAGHGSVGGREKERGKYAQLLDDNRQIFYVSLSAKGKFYEIEQHSAPVLQKHANFGNHHQLHSLNGNNTSSSSAGTKGNQSTHLQQQQQQPHRKPKQLSRDCVHRIGFIMQSEPCLPLNLKLISPQTAGTHSSTVPEYVTIAKISEENFLIACPLDEQQLTTTLTLTKLHLTPQMKFAKCTMGFENEQHMFLNANVQTVLKFCQFNCDHFLRVVDHETNAIELQQMTASLSVIGQQQQQQQSLTMTSNTTTTTGPSSLGSSSTSGGGGGKHESSKSGSDMLRRFGRLFGGGSGGGNDRNGSGHEKEDSIIFLSKNDLESLECGAGGMDDRDQLLHHHQQHHHHSLHATATHHNSLVVDDRTLGGRSEGGTTSEPLSLPIPSYRSEKMKVFASPSGKMSKSSNGGTTAATPSSSSRWFRGFGSRSSANESVSADDEWDKRTSLDRYRDMSKLIQERFGTLGMLSLSSRAASTDRIGAFDDGTIVSHDPGSSVASAGAREKCLSLQHIEQKSKPDLVPPHHRVSSGDDTIGRTDEDDDGASELGDTIFFPLRHSTNQQSFMTQKLYNEFHVKTKQYSKSSSSIQQLLHLAGNGHRSSGSNNLDPSGPTGDKKSALKNRFRTSAHGNNHHDEVVLSFEDLRYMNSVCDESEQEVRGRPAAAKEKRTTDKKAVSLREPTVAERTILDDLPYSSVRDSIVLPAADSDQDNTSVPAESIYAEICTEQPAVVVGGGSPSPTPPPAPKPKTTFLPAVQQTEKRFVSIRINVPPCDSVATVGAVSLNPAGATITGCTSSSSCNSNTSSRCSSAVSSPIEDNIYNTIK